MSVDPTREASRGLGTGGGPVGAVEHLLLTGTPTEIVTGLSTGDPLGLRPRIATRLRERWLFADADRVQLRGVALCATRAQGWRGRSDLGSWVDGCVDRAVSEVACPDQEVPPVPGDAFDSLAAPLGLDPRGLRRACASFNRLPDEIREAFFLLVIDGRTLEDVRDHHGLSAPRAAQAARQGLVAFLNPPPAPPDF